MHIIGINVRFWSCILSLFWCRVKRYSAFSYLGVVVHENGTISQMCIDKIIQMQTFECRYPSSRWQCNTSNTYTLSFCHTIWVIEMKWSEVKWMSERIEIYGNEVHFSCIYFKAFSFWRNGKLVADRFCCVCVQVWFASLS